MSAASPVAVVVPRAASADDRSYVDWPAIFGGAVLAGAISLVLITFGAAVGLSLTSPYEGEGMSLIWYTVAVGLWAVWVQVTAFGAGAYLTGRMRRRIGDATEHEVDVRDGAHGMLVWATGVLLSAIVAFTGLPNNAGTDIGRTVASQVESTEILPQRSLEQAQTARPATPEQAARADRVRKMGILTAFVTAAALLVSLAASVIAAGIGGNHRDQQTVLPHLARRRRVV